MTFPRHPCSRHWNRSRTIPSSATSSPSGSTTTVITLSGLCRQPRLQFAPSAYLFLRRCHQPLPMRMTNPPRSSFRGTPASSSARLFITVIGQSLEIRVHLGSRYPFQVRHYHNDHQRRSQRKRHHCLRCQPAWFPECLRICVVPLFCSLNDKRMMSDIRK